MDALLNYFKLFNDLRPNNKTYMNIMANAEIIRIISNNSQEFKELELLKSTSFKQKIFKKFDFNFFNYRLL